jgi:hypothetical protein
MSKAPLAIVLFLGAAMLFLDGPAAATPQSRVQARAISAMPSSTETKYSGVYSSTPHSEMTAQELPKANSDLPLVAILGFGSLMGSLAAFRTRK